MRSSRPPRTRWDRSSSRSIELKAGVVERDERETGERMLLNYGHTVGHALEAATGYGALLHGEAVAVGMQAAARIAHRMGMLDAAAVERQRRLLERLGLQLRTPGVTRDEVIGEALFGQETRRPDAALGAVRRGRFGLRPR